MDTSNSVRSSNNTPDIDKESLLSIVRTFQEIYDDVINETVVKSQKEAETLIWILDSWIASAEIFKTYRLEDVIHNIQGVLFSYFWRAASWIIYEILTGHYFEALRDLRFLFEGVLLSLHYDYLIDGKVFEKIGQYATFDLKAEVVELAEELREGIRRRDEESIGEIRPLVRKKVEAFVARSNLTEEEKRSYIELYSEVLSQPEIYWSVYKIISQFTKEWNLKEFEDKLKTAWSQLCLYSHFSKKFLNFILRKPENVWIEQYEEELLKKCCNLFITTFDLLLSMILISFPRIRAQVEKILARWKNQLTIELEMTEKTLKSLENETFQ